MGAVLVIPMVLDDPFDAGNKIFEVDVRVTPKRVKENLDRILYADEAMFLSNIGDEDPCEVARIVVERRVTLEFRDDVAFLMNAGLVDEARVIITALADALRSDDSMLARYAGEFMDEYATLLEYSMEEGEPVRGFEY